jgi:hypothetical protein
MQTQAWNSINQTNKINANYQRYDITNENKNISPVMTTNINQNPNVPKIAICIPYNSSWQPEWAEKTYAFLRYFPTDFCNKINFMTKVPSLPVSRDTLVTEAIKANADYVMFVDTDNICETPSDPNVALKTLYQCINKDPDSKDGKMVSGLYRAKQKVGFNYSMWMRAPNGIKGYIPISSWTGNWLQIDVCGLGFCLISTQVFKDVPKPWFYWETSEDISEDFYFFEKAKQRGWNLHVMTDVKLSHLGTLKVKSDGSIVIPDM